MKKIIFSLIVAICSVPFISNAQIKIKSKRGGNVYKKTSTNKVRSSNKGIVVKTKRNNRNIIKVKPNRPRVIVKRPNKKRRGYIWIDGYWKWSVFYGQYIWVDARWEKIKRGHRWVPGYWEQTPSGYFWISGSWILDV
tara:strand:+ start:399 stop:812 length:414 start_codon:yes stop_codon:yes gene_type:complete